MIGVILAAGAGSRLKGTGGMDTCKPLLRVAQKPLITYSLDNLKKLGVQRACIVVGRDGDAIRKTLGDVYQGISLTYGEQKEQKGLIHGFVQGLAATGSEETVILQLADEILVGFDPERVLTAVRDTSYDFYCGIVGEENPEKIKGNYSVQFDSAGNLLSCTEKPSVVTNTWKGTGFCIWRRNAQAFLRTNYDSACNQPGDLCEYMRRLLTEGYTGHVLTVAEKEYNINTPEDLAETERDCPIL